MQLAASLHKSKGQQDRMHVKSITSINEPHIRTDVYNHDPFVPLSIFFTVVLAAFSFFPS
ncbi:hypothetical protein MY10362_006839 [Beauveria mimosiformis]